MKVLIIAPYYAPYTEVSAIRMISLTRQLVENKISVDVLCFSKQTLLRYSNDDELEAKTPNGVNVFHFDESRIRLPLMADVFDAELFNKNVKKHLRKRSYDACIITCGPYFTLKAARTITSFLIPCLLDFRDLGALNYRKIERGKSKTNSFFAKKLKRAYKKYELKREKEAVLSSTHLFCVSHEDSLLMKNSYGLNDSRVSIVRNGYDSELTPSLEYIQKKKNEILKRDEIIIGVFGKFMYYSVERALDILLCLTDLRQKGLNIKLRHIGKPYPWIVDNIEKKGIDKECYEEMGLMTYEEGMKVLAESNCFFVEDNSPDDVGTKIYDYIYINKPVIAAVPCGYPLAKLVSSFKNGFVCQNKEEIFDAINKVISCHMYNLDDELDVEKYSRRYQNNVVIKKLIEVTSFTV